MTNPKIRKYLVLAHLYFAGFLAPAFLMVAISGGLYLLGNKGSFKTESVSLPAAVILMRISNISKTAEPFFKHARHLAHTSN